MQAIAEMALIKAQGDREQAMSEAEWKQLSNLIENDRRERVRLSYVLYDNEFCVALRVQVSRHSTGTCKRQKFRLSLNILYRSAFSPEC